MLKAANAALSMEVIKFLDEQWAIGGAQDGSLSLFHPTRKKPMLTVSAAHGGGPSGAAPALFHATLALC